MLDYGFPRKILESLLSRGCSVDILPASYTAEQVSALCPNGIFLSDGPADPDDNPVYIQNIADMVKLGIPMFAVGLGHQMLALAENAEIVKMPQGHRGSNQPVLVAETGMLMVTEQNHGYTVRAESISADTAEIMMKNINDTSVEGLYYPSVPALSVQFTPNGSPDSSTSWIFDRFVEMLGEVRA